MTGDFALQIFRRLQAWQDASCDGPTGELLMPIEDAQRVFRESERYNTYATDGLTGSLWGWPFRASRWLKPGVLIFGQIIDAAVDPNALVRPTGPALSINPVKAPIDVRKLDI